MAPVEALAERCGATFYRHRTSPHEPAVAFSPTAWLKFVAALDTLEQAPGEDPCPGCRPGIVCRTPRCGRLTKQTLAKVSQIDASLTKAMLDFTRPPEDKS